MKNNQELLIKALKGRAELFGLIGDYNKAKRDYRLIKYHMSCDHNHLIYLIGITSIYEKQGDVKQALNIGEQAISIAEKSGYRFERLKLVCLKVAALFRISKLDEALTLARSALAEFDKLNSREVSRDDIVNAKIALLNTIGSTYYTRMEYDKALTFYRKSNALSTRIRNIQQSGICCSNLCLVYWKMHQYDDAINYGLKGLKLSTQVGDARAISISLNNVGLVYDEMGDYEKGKEYFEKALAHFQRIGDKYGMGIAFFNVGSYYKEIADDPQKAEKCFQQSLNMQMEISDSYGIVDAYMVLAQLHDGTKNNEKFMRYMDELGKYIDKVKIKAIYRSYLFLKIKRAALQNKQNDLMDAVNELYVAYKAVKWTEQDYLTLSSLAELISEFDLIEWASKIQKNIVTP